MTTPAVRVRGLTKSFGSVEAVRGIDLDVGKGEMFGFLGPNGAGKTTTIKILCTLSTPTSGTAEVAGWDVGRDRAAVRRAIGLVFQEPTLDAYLTAEQNLAFHGELYGMPRSLLRERIGVVLEMVDLADRRRDAVKTFSGGMKRRLEIGRGLMHAPSVLFLDEPTIGLDPQTRAAIWDYIGQLRRTQDITIFVTTHYMDEADHCDRIAIIDDGRIVVTDTPDALKRGVGADRVQLRTADDAAAIVRLAERFGIEAATHEHQVTFAVSEGAQFIPRLVTELGVGIDSVTVTRPSLDDVFMAHTGRTLRDAETGGTKGALAMMGGRR
ncbi:daunorubicin resistance protein DrrA family ABC transporter ATP-binding protein [Stackebrandtia nassauensis]|uniref:Daunorubicin resistance ABC transporter ATPase subunit n=1 Tax=Stackebrandtia nassauensis (strain DSM 44728 / CIP 108903 / NRRL B-16338 / NBRC 102104 / LLR-40K-21) TaxID=446470 RepID=D3QAU3_STANL|nr:daunorubicin resistance protein DrrA family ABC transporter ATP-binding protein [Stackebrandtia nassauensis]ADD44739.1 daunorubicin resistance ABC transporter ATPase subunit [Stackebrandtia nassauensis DSM 44728]